MTVITRFAPSPTGMLHIGSARTALFNYLFARHMGGKFLLRIEDTDMARNNEASYAAILDGLKWLGVEYDGDPVYQSRNADRHREIAQQLVARGAAYYCYTTAEELKAQREAAEAKGEQFKYDRKWRDSSEAPPAGVTPSIRIKAPLSGSITVRDRVLGETSVDCAELDDMVIVRSDGTPTYMHAVVVDDHDMGITHVIRGSDHFTNLFRQCVIYDAMGWARPEFAHIPLINDESGKKLSKRKGAASTTDYAEMGYLPEAMRNYLVRLGWSHGDSEIFSDAEAIEWFTLEAIGASPARLDFAKLNHVNAHYMRLRPANELAELIGVEAQYAAAIESVKNKASTLVELKAQLGFYLCAPTRYDEKASATLAKGLDNLALILPALEALSAWDAASIKQCIADTATASGKKLGELMPPMRAALVGSMSGPDIPDAMAILGREESLARLKKAHAKGAHFG